MDKLELIASIVTGVSVISFAAIFTILYKIYANAVTAEYETGKCDVDLIEETIRDNKRNARLRTKVARVLKKILFGVVLAVLIPLLLIALYTKLTGGVAMINGHGVIAVASPSMSQKNSANPYLADINDQFDMYDIIMLEDVRSDGDLGMYDVIAYVNDEGVNIIHRIVGTENTSSGLRYITRGDYNNTDDKYHPSVDDVLGKYTGDKVPFVGAFVIFLQSFSGIVTVLAVIYCLIMIESVGNAIYDAREERLLFLQESIDFGNETVQDDKLDYSFTETVYYKNYAYTFDENGLISKKPVSDQTDDKDTNFATPKSSSLMKDLKGDGDGE